MPPTPSRAAFYPDFKQAAPSAPGPIAIIGGATALVAILAIVFNVALDWGTMEDCMEEGSDSYDAKEFRRACDETNYLHRATATGWPLFSSIFLILLGGALAATALIPMPLGVRKLLQLAVSLLGLWPAIILTLSGTRLLGFQWVHAMDEGDLGWSLGAPPYLNLLFGLAVMGGFAYAARGALTYLLAPTSRGRFGDVPVRLCLIIALIVVALLVLNPVLPFAKGSGTVDGEHFGEGDLAKFADGRHGDAREAPGKDLSLVRTMVWITLFLTPLGLTAALIERTGRFAVASGWLLQVYAGLLLPLLVVATIWTIFLYVDLPSMGAQDTAFGDAPPFSLSLNWLPALALLGLVAAYGLFLVRVTAPFFQSVSAQQGANAPY